MNFFKNTSGVGSKAALATCLLVLASCGNSYQAPVAERSEELAVQRPVLVTSDASGATTSRGQITSVARNTTAAPARIAPAATARPAAAAATPAAAAAMAGRTHRVRRGDTLYSIAFQYDLDFRSLAIANNLNPPYTIRVDQEINLDASNPVSSPAARAATPVAGTVVTDTNVARAQAAVTTQATVIRQTIGSTRSAEPQWSWPLEGSILNHFQTGNGSSKGIDIAGTAGQAVKAAADGDVVYAGNGIQGSSNLIIIRHNDRFLSAYANNSRMLVAEGSAIRAGDTIAEVGQGTDGVARLHFEIRQEGKPVDPLPYLPRQ